VHTFWRAAQAASPRLHSAESKQSKKESKESNGPRPRPHSRQPARFRVSARTPQNRLVLRSVPARQVPYSVQIIIVFRNAGGGDEERRLERRPPMRGDVCTISGDTVLYLGGDGLGPGFCRPSIRPKSDSSGAVDLNAAPMNSNPSRLNVTASGMRRTTRGTLISAN
jgi:hypothetical protein